MDILKNVKRGLLFFKSDVSAAVDLKPYRKAIMGALQINDKPVKTTLHPAYAPQERIATEIYVTQPIQNEVFGLWDIWDVSLSSWSGTPPFPIKAAIVLIIDPSHLAKSAQQVLLRGQKRMLDGGVIQPLKHLLDIPIVIVSIRVSDKAASLDDLLGESILSAGVTVFTYHIDQMSQFKDDIIRFLDGVE